MRCQRRWSLIRKKHPHANVRTEYVRHYPQGDMAAHLLGYVSSEGAPPAGPILRGEPLWQRTGGAAGLEAAFNKQLTGTDGTLCVMMSDAGTVAYEQVFVAPEGGRDVVTTLNLDTQRVAENAAESIRQARCHRHHRRAYRRHPRDGEQSTL
jgi:penicillin-binding protein 2